MRLAKFLAHAGVASRRAAEGIVGEGRVTVAGVIVTDPARDVTGDEPVAVDGDEVALVASHAVWAVHKPAGVVSTAKDTHGRPTVLDLVDAPERRLYPVGRLDADTTGLILLTDDGDLANRLTHPRYEVPKVYVAHVGGHVKAATLRQLRDGVELDDGRTAPAKVRQLEPGTLELTLREGRKRQVRRMLEAVGHPVRKLSRVAFGPLRLGDLGEGRARKLGPAEVERLRQAAAPADIRRALRDAPWEGPASAPRESAGGRTPARGPRAGAGGGGPAKGPRPPARGGGAARRRGVR